MYLTIRVFVDHASKGREVQAPGPISIGLVLLGASVLLSVGIWTKVQTLSSEVGVVLWNNCRNNSGDCPVYHSSLSPDSGIINGT